MTKQEIIEKFALHEGDTGSPEVQIALLTERINHLNEHLKYALQYRFRMLRQKNPEYCKYFDQHIDEHRAAIAEKEQEAMARAMAMQSSNNNERRM